MQRFERQRVRHERHRILLASALAARCGLCTGRLALGLLGLFSGSRIRGAARFRRGVLGGCALAGELLRLALRCDRLSSFLGNAGGGVGNGGVSSHDDTFHNKDNGPIHATDACWVNRTRKAHEIGAFSCMERCGQVELVRVLTCEKKLSSLEPP